MVASAIGAVMPFRLKTDRKERSNNFLYNFGLDAPQNDGVYIEQAKSVPDMKAVPGLYVGQKNDDYGCENRQVS